MTREELEEESRAMLCGSLEERAVNAILRAADDPKWSGGFHSDYVGRESRARMLGEAAAELTEEFACFVRLDEVRPVSDFSFLLGRVRAVFSVGDRLEVRRAIRLGLEFVGGFGVEVETRLPQSEIDPR